MTEATKEELDWRERAKRWLRPRLAWMAAAVAFAAAVALIVIQLDGERSSPDSTTLGLFALAALLGFAFLAPGLTVEALRRVSRFKVGNIELGLAEIKRAERVRPPLEDDGVRSEPRKGKGYTECVKRLERRLEHMRGVLDLEARKTDHCEIAEELRLKKLLNRDEETFVLDLLKNYDPVSDDWSTAIEQEFLDATWAFATRFRALVWDRRVRQQLQDDGWFIAGYEQKPGHRPDFLIHREGLWGLVASRVGSLTSENPDKLDVAAKRLARFAEKEGKGGPDIAGRSIVMPDATRGFLSPKLSSAVKAEVMVHELDGISGENWRRAVGG